MPPFNMYGVMPAQRRHPQVRGKNVPLEGIQSPESQTAGSQGVQPGVERLINFRNATAAGPASQQSGAEVNLPRLGAVPMQGGGSAFSTTKGAGWNPETPGQLQARALGQSLGINNIGGYAPGTGHVANSDHYRNRAYDFMTGANQTQGYNLISKLQPSWSKLGIKYIIFNGQINKGNGWQTYHPPGGKTDATSMHRDHVHVSFY